MRLGTCAFPSGVKATIHLYTVAPPQKSSISQIVNMIICILWFTAEIPKLSYCSLLIKGDFSPINPPGVSDYITMHGVKTFKGSQWELKHRSGSHLT